MVFSDMRLRRVAAMLCISIIIIVAAAAVAPYSPVSGNAEVEPKKFIKYVEFNVPYSALEKAMNIDIKRHGAISWVEILAQLACKYGGEWKRYKASDMDSLVKKIETGEALPESKYLTYFREAYDAVLSGFLGWYMSEKVDEKTGKSTWDLKYGLKVFSPIAKGYPYQHFDDFGAGRSYGYKRRHLGHDMMGQTGTPVIAVESGTVEATGWNQYGGWRIGIRSFDKKRYYYYAHLRKNRPFHTDLYEGKTVTAGDVIGYMGRTGYSSNENVNNIETTHLHYGLELIFDESQKECVNEIWIDLYNITRLLDKHRSQVIKNEETKEYYRKYDFIECGEEIK